MSLSCHGKMVRRSRQSLSCSVYPTMAGVEVRSVRESLLREMPVGLMAMAMDGICDVGMVPPPVVAVDEMMEMSAFEVLDIFLMMFCARSFRFSVGSARFLSVGMSVWLGSAWVRRYSSILSWRTVRMSLSQRMAR